MMGIITLERALATIESGVVTAETGIATAGVGTVTAEAGAATAEPTSATLGAVSMLDVEIFEGVPLWVILLIASTVIFVILIILLISWVFHAEKEAKRKVHHPPTTHDVVVELQRELLKSMESTSRQNRLMIWLTILFITVSIVGGAVVINFFQNIKDFCAVGLAQFVEFLNSVFSQ